MRYTFYILFSTILLLLNSCVKEDDVFDEDSSIKTSSTTVTTSLITTFLNEEFLINSVDTENCFSLNFPIQLVYNTQQIISINNFNGLQQAANSQSSSFFIDSVVFPITVTANNQQVNITNLVELIELFNSCNVPTLKNIILEKNNSSCFSLEYPLNVINNEGENLVIINNESFILFLESTSNNYITEFIFPINVNETTISNYFNLHQILNNCEIKDCIEININNEQIDNKTYLFYTQFNTTQTYSINWYVNDELLIDIKDSSFTYQFTNDGTYEVCAQMISDNQNCSEQQIVCTTVEVIICPDFVISSNLISNDGKEYLFQINEANTNLDSLFWEIMNEDSQETTVIDFNNDGYEVTYEFIESGIYTVCVTETTNCGIQKCETIDVQIDPCPILEISQELISTIDGTTYQFNAFGAEESDRYFWSVNGEYSLQTISGNMNETLEYYFSSEGNYEICVGMENSECTTGVQKCILIVIE